MGGILTNVPLPANDPIAQPKRSEFGKQADPQEGKVTLPWIDFFTSLGVAVQQSASRIASAVLTAQTSAIGAIDISSGNLAPGLYRLSYHATITTAAAASSSLTVTLDWVYLGVAKAFSGVAITSNTTAANQSETKLILIDGASPVRYSTTYASNLSNQMTYVLAVTLERVDA